MRKREKTDPKYETHRETVRFHYKKCNKFELLKEQSSRIKIVIFDQNMDPDYLNKLSFHEKIFNNQTNDY